MKKFVLLLLVYLVITTSAQAQSRQSAYAKEKAYEQKDILLTAGASFGYSGFYGTYTSASVPIIVAVEYAFLKYVSIGGFVGYQSYSYTDTYQEALPPYTNVNYSYVYSAISLGLKGSFHVLPYLNDRFKTGIDDSRMDAYLTAYVGASFHSYREVTSTGYTGYDKLVPRYIVGPGAGFRYMFIDRFGAFAEAGVGAVGFTTVGVVYKL